MKLVNVAAFIHYHHSLTLRPLTFLGAPKAFYRLMIVPLIQPAVATANANLVIKMNVGLETTFGARESDPSFIVISDSSRCIGMFTFYKNNYKTSAPCLGIEGASGPTMSHRRSDAYLPKQSESYNPGRFEIQLSLSDPWGTCFVPLDGGFSREMIYQNKLNPGNGLFLEIYGDEPIDKEGMKYIEITILRTSVQYMQ